MDLAQFNDLVITLSNQVKTKLNITPTWLILDKITYINLRVTLEEHMSYLQSVTCNTDLYNTDLYNGLKIAITTGNKPTIEVR